MIGMGKDIVIFTDTNAIHVKDVVLLPFADKRAVIVRNPNLIWVKDVPTYFWKQDRGQIKEMSPVEKEKRLLKLRMHKGSETEVPRFLYIRSIQDISWVIVCLIFFWLGTLVKQ